jgi:hypothetical protein
MPNLIAGNKVKLIKLESGREWQPFVGKSGTIEKCDKFGDRRFYWVRFLDPVEDILFLYRPEIKKVED